MLAHASDLLETSKELRRVCNLDIKKAYDHVNWKFSINLLKNMGFGRKWAVRCSFCVSTIKYSDLVNGTPEASLLLKGVYDKETLFLLSYLYW